MRECEKKTFSLVQLYINVEREKKVKKYIKKKTLWVCCYLLQRFSFTVDVFTVVYVCRLFFTGGDITGMTFSFMGFACAVRGL